MRISAHKRASGLDRLKSEVGFMKYHACRLARFLPQPRGNLGILPASEAASKRLHTSAAKATNNVLPAVMQGYSVWRWVVVYPDRLTVNYITD
jgi:hypothetical protein